MKLDIASLGIVWLIDYKKINEQPSSPPQISNFLFMVRFSCNKVKRRAAKWPVNVEEGCVVGPKAPYTRPPQEKSILIKNKLNDLIFRNGGLGVVEL